MAEPDGEGKGEPETTTEPAGHRGRARMTARHQALAMIRERFSDRGEIARGGQGVIRRVFDKNLQRYVALKVVDPKLAARADGRGRVLDEARITGQLDHPNIVPIYDLVETDDTIEFTMKLVEGETLSTRLRRKHGTELSRLLEIFLKVCDAVAFAHSRGVIHRDLKPSNIMLGEFNQVYVMDWGCAYIMANARVSADYEALPRRSVVDETGTVIGTSAYMAPEQALGRNAEIDERTDVFGLGAVLYQILTGIAPYRGGAESEERERARAGIVRPPAEAAQGRTPPADLSAIAMRALARDKADRYPTVAALRDEVERFLHRGAFFTPQPFAAGTLIVREGDLADEAFVITAGQCEVFREERGRRVSLRTLGPGDVFGEGALFQSEPRNASVIAVDDVMAIVVTHEVLDRGLGGDDSWLGTMIRALLARYRDLEARHTLSRRVVENARIATELVHHISRAGTWIRPGVLGTSWSRTWATLAAVCRISEEEALSIVERSPDLDYDAKADEITLALLSMA